MIISTLNTYEPGQSPRIPIRNVRTGEIYPQPTIIIHEVTYEEYLSQFDGDDLRVRVSLNYTGRKFYHVHTD